MSFDLMVFEVSKAPQNKKDFMEWYKRQLEWSEDHDYDDAELTSPALRDWYYEMIASYPAMNGPDAPDDDALDADPDLEDRLTDYSVGHDVIYAAFAWSEAEKARELMWRLANKYGAGFFDISAQGGIWLPDGREIK